MNRICTFWLAMLTPVLAGAQDDMLIPSRKNAVKYVLTTNVFYNQAIVVGYERVLNRTQSLNVVGGALKLPAFFVSDPSIRVDKDNSARGFTGAIDYRFYLPKENKYAPPHGIYVAPFISYYNFTNEMELVSTSSATANNAYLRSKLAFFNIGAQIGYQFVIKDRLTFDVIFLGPSITNYRVDLDLDGNFTVEEENEVVQELLDRLPLLDQLIEDESVEVNGSTNTWSMGYRFTCMIGYCFGKR